MSATKWVEVCCIVPDSMADPLADFLLECTGNGVSIDNRTVDTFNVEELTEEAEKSVKGYLPDDENLARIVAEVRKYLETNGPLFEGFSFRPPIVSPLREEDWQNSWKANFKPARIGRRLVMKPSWEIFEAAAGDILLELDPGMAFGTGTHGTTRLCLEALEKLVFDEKMFSRVGGNVLDVGCGSGVLGIAAALFGAARVTAIDIDPVAVGVTEDNARINGVADRLTASITPLDMVRGSFAIVFANILAEELVRLAVDLFDRVKPEGYLVLSGILTEREAFVREAFSALQLVLHEATHMDEWCCLVYRKVG